MISRVKLIAEPWDATAEGYQVGNFPPGWSEWDSTEAHVAVPSGPIAHW